jgi:hypothetical protein
MPMRQNQSVIIRVELNVVAKTVMSESVNFWYLFNHRLLIAIISIKLLIRKYFQNRIRPFLNRL